MIGQLLAGRYLILETLGTGGFSETYLARDKYLPEYPLCVVKRLQLPPASPIDLATAHQFFAREAQILGQLSHDQIPTLLAYCGEPEQVYLVQEYIEGESLAHWVEAGNRLTAAAAITLLLDLLPVLAYIHEQDVIHHDIKPHNVIYRHRDYKLVLIDFGAADRLSDRVSDQMPDQVPGRAATSAPLTIGTPGYMPDEQDYGQSQFNSDLYALGILVIYLLTGIDPAQFQVDPISGELAWRCYLPDPTIAPPLLKILDQMVRVAWRDRYAQATDVITDLQALTTTRLAPAKSIKQRWVPSQRQFWQQVRGVAGWLLVVGVIGGIYLSINPGPTKALWARWNVWIKPSDLHLHKLYEIPLSTKLDRMVIAPNDRILVTAGADRVLRTWSLKSGSRLRTLAHPTGKITALSISRDSQLLVSGSQDGTIYLWHLESGKLLRTFKGQSHPVLAVAINPKANMIASSQGGTMRLWQTNGKLAQTWTIPDVAITAITYGAPGQLISASSARADPRLSQIQVWDWQTGKLQQTLIGHTTAIGLLQSVDSARLVSVGADRALLWNLPRQELATVFPIDSARSLAAVWHNQHLVTVHPNGSIRLWTKQAEPLSKQVGQLRPSQAVALSANQRYVVCWGADQRLRVWQMDPRAIANF
jgi:serine/threonine protein kinase